jgi:ABC-2 type transport system ATP-binding protein
MPADLSYAIETSSLKKDFRGKTAVKDLTLTVRRGEVFGFLGPNGAGKTTSVKMLLGLVSPTSGNGRLLGAALGDPAARARVGFLPEHFRFHEWLTAREFLALHANLYRMPHTNASRRMASLLDLVGLSAFASQKLGTFSKGMLQRIGLAQALLNEPDLVILDEPTSGLDPVGRRLVRDIIHDLRENGTAVFLNSHLLSEVEVTCDRVAFIRQGEVVRISSLKDLADGPIPVEVRARGLNAHIIEGLKLFSTDIRADGETLLLTLPKEDDIPQLNRYLVEQGVEVFALQPRKESLEDMFIQIVGTQGGL